METEVWSYWRKVRRRRFSRKIIACVLIVSRCPPFLCNWNLLVLPCLGSFSIFEHCVLWGFDSDSGSFKGCILLWLKGSSPVVPSQWTPNPHEVICLEEINCLSRDFYTTLRPNRSTSSFNTASSPTPPWVLFPLTVESNRAILVNFEGSILIHSLLWYWNGSILRPALVKCL